MKPQSQQWQLHNKRLGQKGEELAVVDLMRRGYKIICRNFKARYGEIDIIATKDDTLVFVEVKTRIGDEYGLPEEAVTKRKLHEVAQTAHYFALTHTGLPEQMRIDVVAVELTEEGKLKALRHLENVSQMG